MSGNRDYRSVFRCRFEMLKRTEKDWKMDGLNSLSYRLLHIKYRKLYTHILVDLLEGKERFEMEQRICKNETQVKKYPT
ncbi:unnamed protein product [Heligmosomoides polygyrus]|uniref:Uncharacterized protein n=1 Tax=Heligmosomoides polygyrus TaxID=6339 RepID=A0A183GSD6_HELPZ|nr:unnamed protein product [Heligmosomoides polygyrus]